MKLKIVFFQVLIALLCMDLPAAAQKAPAAVSQEQHSSDEQAGPPKKGAESQPADTKIKAKVQMLTAEKDELKAAYELELQKQKTKTAELEAELARATSENKLAEEKRKAAIAKLETDYQKLTTQNKLSAEQSKALSAAQDYELAKLVLENRMADEKSKRLVLELSGRIARLKAENDLTVEQQRMDLLSDTKERNRIDIEVKRTDLEERRLKVERLAMESRLNKINSDLELRLKRTEWKKESNTEPVYTLKPFSNGKLVVSDRRVALNGPIFSGVAEYVTERIHYYNNISSQPVFIVIDICPGGSVMEGYRILKAMQSSKAPIYVVVKSFAASMAAVITTMADKSYVYPNAIILHHQMSTMNWGNMTQLKEQLEKAREWERRLHVPVSKKMGISIEEFRKKMYEKNSAGDWEEFGDKAVEYKWATNTVEEIEETGITKNPDETEPVRTKGRIASTLPLEEQTDEAGRQYVSLPRLAPFDFYFIYNPDRYYR